MRDSIYKNILWSGVTGSLIFAALARGAVSLWSVTPVLMVIVLFVFLWFWRLSGQERVASMSTRFSPADVLIFLFIALAVVSSIFSVYKHDSLNALTRLLVFVGLYYLVRYNFDAQMRNRLLWVIATFGVLLSCYGLLQYFGKAGHSWWEPSEFLAATYVNHNHFAGYFELVIPVAISIMIALPSARFYLRLMLGAGIVILLAAFVLTQSRAGWISLGIALLVMGAILVRRAEWRRKNFFIFAIIAMIVATFTYSYKNVLAHRVEKVAGFAQGEKEPSLESRVLMWRAAAEMIRDRSLTGVGFGAFDAGLYRSRPAGLSDQRVVYAHNDYLHLAAEMGVFAPLLMVGILFVLLSAGLKKGADFSIIGCAIGILSLSLHGLADFNFHIPANMLLLTVYAAFIMSTTKQSKR